MHPDPTVFNTCFPLIAFLAAFAGIVALWRAIPGDDESSYVSIISIDAPAPETKEQK